jgi:hypothetical protein
MHRIEQVQDPEALGGKERAQLVEPGHPRPELEVVGLDDEQLGSRESCGGSGEDLRLKAMGVQLDEVRRR